MPLTLILLVALAAAAATIAGYALIAARQRRQVIGRTLLGGDYAVGGESILIGVAKPSRLRERLAALAPSSWRENARIADKLVQAGYDQPTAVLSYRTVQLATATMLPALTALLAPRASFVQLVLLVGVAALIGLIVPVYYLERRVRQRQERLRRSLPDAVDLLVLCVEAGLGFDAAILRVAREVREVHTELARELMLVSRKVNAGLTREEALRGMATRTGTDEVRVLVQNLIQSERLGSSLGTVLRVYAETLRRKRRQVAERKAAVAPLKMTFPLALMILPALFVVILGPVLIRVMAWLGS